MIDPRENLSAHWDIYVAVLLILTIFTMPLSMAFLDIQQTLKPLDLLADVTFLLDILKHFNTGDDSLRSFGISPVRCDLGSNRNKIKGFFL